MKKRLVAVVLLCLFLMQSVVFAHWADPYCTLLQKNQIMFGDEQGFRADDPLLRCEFAAMLNRAFSFSVKSSADMPDVPKNAWYYKDCAILYNAGVLTGDENKHINPERTVTRAEMAVMLSRAMGLSVQNKKSPDVEDVPNWAYGAVLALEEMNIVSGYPDGTFRGNNNLLRGEAAAVLAKILEAGAFSGGNGSIANPYRITKPEQFAFISTDRTASYRLMCDVVFDEIPMPVIGSKEMPFNGTFDGGFYRIIAKNSQDASNVLFGCVGLSGMVTKVRLLCPDTRMALCDTNNGKITLCANTSFINGTPDYVKQFGGIAYENYGKIDRCYNASDVVALDAEHTAGGIAGLNDGTVENCFNVGTVAKNCGAIAGENKGKIQNCYTLSGEIANSGKGTETNVYSGKNPGVHFSAEAFVPQNRVMGIADFPFMGNENFTHYAGGEGVSDNPYRIETIAQFENISENPDKFFVQTADLKGITRSVFDFSGVYDGNGYKLQTVRLQADADTALFLQNDGVLKNIHITDGSIRSKNNVAGLAMHNNGQISGCFFEGSLSGGSSAGLVYQNGKQGIISESYTLGRIEAGGRASGLVFQNDGTVSDVYSAAEVLSAQGCGIAFYNSGSLKSAYFAGSMPQGSGGLIYSNSGTAIYGYTFLVPAVLTNNGKTENVVTAAQSQMKNIDMYFGFDTIHVWESSADGAYPYPVLTKNPHYTVQYTENYTEFAGGDGSANNPYKIVTPKHLQKVKDYPGAHFILMNNLNLAETQTDSKALVAEVFYGTFNGNRMQILGLSGDKPLFGENYGSVSALYIKDANLSGESIAPFAMKNYGTISKCSFIGDMQAENGAGLVLANEGRIELCNTDGNFNGSYLAGLVLSNSGTVLECHSAVRMSGKEAYGLVKNDGGTVSDSWFGGYLTANNLYPTAQAGAKNCYYLNYYGRADSEAKSIADFRDNPPRLGENWQQKDGFPVLKNMPEMTLPLFDMEGDGSAENPYKIRLANQLRYLGMYPDKHFVLVQNIKANDLLFTPVETFRGVLDGNQKTISLLTVYGEQAGLVQRLEGKIKNLIFADVMAEGRAETGAVAAINSGVIENCTVKSGRIGTAGLYAGGICGRNAGDGLLDRCENGGDVFSAYATGGVSGINEGTVVLCRNIGGAVATAQAVQGIAGGIAGVNNGVIDRCYNNGKIFAYSESEASNAGGIAGLQQNSISNGYNTGEIHAKAKKQAYAGGIAGVSAKKTEIRACYNTGFTNATADETGMGSASGKANGGTLYGFVHENTVAEPVGAGAMKEDFVTPQAIDVMYRKEGYKTFDFDSVWGFEYDNGFYTAQLKENPQKIKIAEENLIDFAGGDGSMDNPYRILTPEQLNNVRKHLGATFVLLGDIDMSGYCKAHSFKPIGDNVFSFYGLFVGNNYQISGLKIDGEEFGLFRENHGEIYNCFFEDISGNGSGGTVAAYNTGLIYNCMQIGAQQATGNSENVNRGGLVGVNKSTGMVISSYNAGDISVQGENVQVGGIAYGNHGVISGSFNSGEIAANAQKLSVSGGIAAHNFGIVSDCYSANTIRAESEIAQNSFAGGIVGNNGGTVVNTYFSGDSVSASNFGSIAATNTSAVYNGYYMGRQGIGRDNGSSENVIQCTDQQLKMHDTFAGFDFENMWIMDASFKYPYPQFIEIAHR